jgi:voltage-gated potassium channel
MALSNRASEPQSSAEPTLSRRSSAGPIRVLAVRALIAIGLLAGAFLLLWFDRAGLRDNIDGHLSFIDIIYFTMITITTVGYGDIVPVSEHARMIDAFLLTPIRLFIWLLFLGTAVDLLFKRSWERWRMKQIQRKLSGHVILAGFGRTGSKVGAQLLVDGISPDQVVVIDCSAHAIEQARPLGVAVLQGDASDNEVLKAVNIDRAANLIVSAGRDDASILIVLSARSLAPELPISVAINAEDNEDIASRAGADTVINPITISARMLANTTRKNAIEGADA